MSFAAISQALHEISYFEAHRLARLEQMARATGRTSPLPIDVHGLRIRYDALLAARDHFAQLSIYDVQVRALLSLAKGSTH